MIDFSTIALIFPGQASQQVGMGADLAAQYPAAAQVFTQADQIYGSPFSKLLFEGPAEALDQTINTQPALYIGGIATLRALESALGAAPDSLAPVAVAGHSLGEFTALTAAGALSFEDGLRLVRERARLMAEAGQHHPGAMAALLGAEVADVRAICEQASAETGAPVVLANDNCPGQVVISGDTAAVEKALELAKGRGIRKQIRLAVSVAAHSPLMAEAAQAFREVLAGIEFRPPRVPIFGNTTAARLTTRDEIRAELSAQLTGSVLWTDSIRAMRGLGVQTFLELGPKDVLTNLIKRIERDAAAIPVNSAAALATVVGTPE